MHLAAEILKRGFAVRASQLPADLVSSIRRLSNSFVTGRETKSFDKARIKQGLHWAEITNWATGATEQIRRRIRYRGANRTLRDSAWWGAQSAKGCQLAVTFSSVGDPRRFSAHPSYRLQPHTDGYPSPEKPYVWRARLIVGVLLDKVSSHEDGAFCVAPRSHLFLSREYKDNPPVSCSPEDLSKWRRAAMGKWIRGQNPKNTLRGFKPIIGEPGTIVFMHPVLIHGTHPRTTSGIRRMIFFRHLESQDRKEFCPNLSSLKHAAYASASEEYHSQLAAHFLD